jgi:hypothetical protein
MVGELRRVLITHVARPCGHSCSGAQSARQGQEVRAGGAGALVDDTGELSAVQAMLAAITARLAAAMTDEGTPPACAGRAEPQASGHPGRVAGRTGHGCGMSD